MHVTGAHAIHFGVSPVNSSSNIRGNKQANRLREVQLFEESNESAAVSERDVGVSMQALPWTLVGPNMLTRKIQEWPIHTSALS
jgi:hypothetical protein